MRQSIILDAGPLVAFLSERDAYHDWVTQQVTTIQSPLLTCEAVLTEACFLLRKHFKAPVVMEMVHQDFISIPFHLNKQETALIKNLMTKYANLPMSFADACLVRMSEQFPHSTILTLDSDFRIYRKHGNQLIPVIMPSIQ